MDDFVLDEIVDRADINRDGTISFNEFISLVAEYFHRTIPGSSVSRKMNFNSWKCFV